VWYARLVCFVGPSPCGACLFFARCGISSLAVTANGLALMLGRLGPLWVLRL